MEAILGFIGIMIFFAIWQGVMNAGAKTAAATARTLGGKGSFSQNMELQFKGMGTFQTRLNVTTVGDDGLEAIEIQAKGLFPVSRVMTVGLVTSVLDFTDGEDSGPVLSRLELFQEESTTAFQCSQDDFEAKPGFGFPDWATVGVIIPSLLQAPNSGRRKLKAIFRVVDKSCPPRIHLGYTQSGNDKGTIFVRSHDFERVIECKGYMEEARDHEDACGLAIELAMAVAMADGSLDETEGNVLKTWIQKQISVHSEAKRERLKTAYNDAMRTAHALATEGNLSLSDITAKLNAIGDVGLKYEAIELCHDVMAADGVAEAEEMKVIRMVTGALDLDAEELARIRDRALVELDSTTSTMASIEEILGIDPSWDAGRTRSHLVTEFKKWSDRLNALPEGSERDSAQNMIDRIGVARQKYD
jgi:tellurite resistance protein